MLSLHKAAADGRTAEVAQLLNEGKDIHTADQDGRTALHAAAASGQVSAVVELLKRAARVDALDKDGYTPLHLAALAGDLATVKDLLAHGANVHAVDTGHKMTFFWNPNQCPALHKAASRGHKAVVRLLVEHGADLSAKDPWGFTPLHVAAYQNYPEVINTLVELHANPNEQDKRGCTPLMVAAEKGNTQAVWTLCKCQADSSCTNQEGQTALHLAAAKGFETVVRLLVQQGAPLEAINQEGQTAVHLAACNGQVAVLQQLLKKKANANATDKHKSTPLHEASAKGHSAVVKMLLKYGAECNAKDDDGCTSLHKAAARCTTLIVGYEEVACTLISAGLEVDATSNEGQTALMLASFQGHVSFVQCLLESGADLFAQDKDGRTALDFAVATQHLPMMELLAPSPATTSCSSQVRQSYECVVDDEGETASSAPAGPRVDAGEDVNGPSEMVRQRLANWSPLRRSLSHDGVSDLLGLHPATGTGTRAPIQGAMSITPGYSLTKSQLWGQLAGIQATPAESVASTSLPRYAMSPAPHQASPLRGQFISPSPAIIKPVTTPLASPEVTSRERDVGVSESQPHNHSNDNAPAPSPGTSRIPTAPVESPSLQPSPSIDSRIPFSPTSVGVLEPPAGGSTPLQSPSFATHHTPGVSSVSASSPATNSSLKPAFTLPISSLSPQTATSDRDPFTPPRSTRSPSPRDTTKGPLLQSSPDQRRSITNRRHRTDNNGILSPTMSPVTSPSQPKSKWKHPDSAGKAPNTPGSRPIFGRKLDLQSLTPPSPGNTLTSSRARERSHDNGPFSPPTSQRRRSAAADNQATSNPIPKLKLSGLPSKSKVKADSDTIIRRRDQNTRTGLVPTLSLPSKMPDRAAQDRDADLMSRGAGRGRGVDKLPEPVPSPPPATQKDCNTGIGYRRGDEQAVGGVERDAGVKQGTQAALDTAVGVAECTVSGEGSDELGAAVEEAPSAKGLSIEVVNAVVPESADQSEQAGNRSAPEDGSPIMERVMLLPMAPTFSMAIRGPSQQGRYVASAAHTETLSPLLPHDKDDRSDDDDESSSSPSSPTAASDISTTSSTADHALENDLKDQTQSRDKAAQGKEQDLSIDKQASDLVTGYDASSDQMASSKYTNMQEAPRAAEAAVSFGRGVELALPLVTGPSHDTANASSALNKLPRVPKLGLALSTVPVEHATLPVLGERREAEEDVAPFAPRGRQPSGEGIGALGVRGRKNSEEDIMPSIARSRKGSEQDMIPSLTRSRQASEEDIMPLVSRGRNAPEDIVPSDKKDEKHTLTGGTYRYAQEGVESHTAEDACTTGSTISDHVIPTPRRLVDLTMGVPQTSAIIQTSSSGVLPAPRNTEVQLSEVSSTPRSSRLASDEVIPTPTRSALRSKDILTTPRSRVLSEEMSHTPQRSAPRSTDVTNTPLSSRLESQDITFTPRESALRSTDVMHTPRSSRLESQDVTFTPRESSLRSTDVMHTPRSRLEIPTPRGSALRSTDIIVTPRRSRLMSEEVIPTPRGTRFVTSDDTYPTPRHQKHTSEDTLQLPTPRRHRGYSSNGLSSIPADSVRSPGTLPPLNQYPADNVLPTPRSSKLLTEQYTQENGVASSSVAEARGKALMSLPADLVRYEGLSPDRLGSAAQEGEVGSGKKKAKSGTSSIVPKLALDGLKKKGGFVWGRGNPSPVKEQTLNRVPTLPLSSTSLSRPAPQPTPNELELRRSVSGGARSARGLPHSSTTGSLPGLLETAPCRILDDDEISDVPSTSHSNNGSMSARTPREIHRPYTHHRSSLSTSQMSVDALDIRALLQGTVVDPDMPTDNLWSNLDRAVTAQPSLSSAAGEAPLPEDWEAFFRTCLELRAEMAQLSALQTGENGTLANANGAAPGHGGENGVPTGGMTAVQMRMSREEIMEVVRRSQHAQPVDRGVLEAATSSAANLLRISRSSTPELPTRPSSTHSDMDLSFALQPPLQSPPVSRPTSSSAPTIPKLALSLKNPTSSRPPLLNESPPTSSRSMDPRPYRNPPAVPPLALTHAAATAQQDSSTDSDDEPCSSHREKYPNQGEALPVQDSLAVGSETGLGALKGPDDLTGSGSLNLSLSLGMAEGVGRAEQPVAQAVNANTPSLAAPSGAGKPKPPQLPKMPALDLSQLANPGGPMSTSTRLTVTPKRVSTNVIGSGRETSTINLTPSGPPALTAGNIINVAAGKQNSIISSARLSQASARSGVSNSSFKSSSSVSTGEPSQLSSPNQAAESAPRFPFVPSLKLGQPESRNLSHSHQRETDSVTLSMNTLNTEASTAATPAYQVFAINPLAHSSPDRRESMMLKSSSLHFPYSSSAGSTSHEATNTPSSVPMLNLPVFTPAREQLDTPQLLPRIRSTPPGAALADSYRDDDMTDSPFSMDMEEEDITQLAPRHRRKLSHTAVELEAPEVSGSTGASKPSIHAALGLTNVTASKAGMLETEGEEDTTLTSLPPQAIASALHDAEATAKAATALSAGATTIVDAALALERAARAIITSVEGADMGRTQSSPQARPEQPLLSQLSFGASSQPSSTEKLPELQRGYSDPIDPAEPVPHPPQGPGYSDLSNPLRLSSFPIMDILPSPHTLSANPTPTPTPPHTPATHRGVQTPRSNITTPKGQPSIPEEGSQLLRRAGSLHSGTVGSFPLTGVEVSPLNMNLSSVDSALQSESSLSSSLTPLPDSGISATPPSMNPTGVTASQRLIPKLDLRPVANLASGEGRLVESRYPAAAQSAPTFPSMGPPLNPTPLPSSSSLLKPFTTVSSLSNQTTPDQHTAGTSTLNLRFNTFSPVSVTFDPRLSASNSITSSVTHPALHTTVEVDATSLHGTENEISSPPFASPSITQTVATSSTPGSGPSASRKRTSPFTTTRHQASRSVDSTSLRYSPGVTPPVARRTRSGGASTASKAPSTGMATPRSRIFSPPGAIARLVSPRGSIRSATSTVSITSPTPSSPASANSAPAPLPSPEPSIPSLRPFRGSTSSLPLHSTSSLPISTPDTPASSTTSLQTARNNITLNLNINGLPPNAVPVPIFLYLPSNVHAPASAVPLLPAGSVNVTSSTTSVTASLSAAGAPSLAANPFMLQSAPVLGQSISRSATLDAAASTPSDACVSSGAVYHATRSSLQGIHVVSPDGLQGGLDYSINLDASDIASQPSMDSIQLPASLGDLTGGTLPQRFHSEMLLERTPSFLDRLNSWVVAKEAAQKPQTSQRAQRKGAGIKQRLTRMFTKMKTKAARESMSALPSANSSVSSTRRQQE